ncbi:MAG: YdcF family protein, partial [Pseudomonadota bacterium]|nr:YdcF family protein [Pseudomonadota bacterium]
LYVMLFALFGVTLGNPAPAGATTDAIVVITGGSGRIEEGIKRLGEHRAGRMLIAGADPSVTKADLARRLGGKQALLNCCVDLGSESVDTRSNAEEAKRWLDAHGYRSLTLVTSDWHMRRAHYEFASQLGRGYEITPDAVRTEPNLMMLFAEYNKYLLRRMAVWLDV